jgi:hypothetical protein
MERRSAGVHSKDCAVSHQQAVNTGVLRRKPEIFCYRELAVEDDEEHNYLNFRPLFPREPEFYCESIFSLPCVRSSINSLNDFHAELLNQNQSAKWLSCEDLA